MQISNLSNTINFNGFKNVVSYGLHEGTGIGYSYMAAQLNNEDGHNDLDIWKQIQKDLFQKKQTSDFAFFGLIDLGDKQFFTADTEVLELDTVNPKNEKLTLKAITLLASITQRIINSNFVQEDKYLYQTLIEVLKNLTIITNNRLIAETLTTAGALKQIKHHKTAELINSKITTKMKQYFKL